MSTTLLDLITQPGQQAPPTMIAVEPESPEEQLQQQWSHLMDVTRPRQPSQIYAAPHHGFRESEWRWSSLYEHLLRVRREGTRQSVFYSAVSNFGYLRRKLNTSSDAVRNAVDMNLQIMHGNPVFRGTRIPVYQIIEELADGTSLREIPQGYPSLTLEQIQNGLDFAASVLRIYDEQIPHR